MVFRTDLLNDVEQAFIAATNHNAGNHYALPGLV
jgi:hypothetical protein